MKQVFSHNETYSYHPVIYDNDGNSKEGCDYCGRDVDTPRGGSAECICWIQGTRPVYIDVVDYYTLGCNKTEQTLLGYELGCGKTEDTVESVIIKY